MLSARSRLLLLAVFAWCGLCLSARDSEGPQAPRVTSVFPLGGQLGTRIEAEVRGLALDGAYAVWFDGAGLRADIVGVEEVALLHPKAGAREEPGGGAAGRPGHRVGLRVSIDGSTRPGVHALRLVSAGGFRILCRSSWVPSPWFWKLAPLTTRRRTLSR